MNAEGKKWPAKCPKCSTDFPKPPRNWDCPRCNVKTWQPDEGANSCEVCQGPVAKFTRHHCRSCGLVTCTECAKYTTIIPEWSPTEKQRVCKRCAVPNAPAVMEGYLQKLGAKHAIFGEKFQSRFFELRGAVLLYSKERGAAAHGQIDLDGAKVMDVAIHPNAFCLIGPKLQRGYVLSAETPQQKAAWVEAITAQLKSANANRSAADDEEENSTQSVLYSKDSATSSAIVGMSDFELLTVLGLGSFGRVMKVREKRTGQILAMKVLDKAQIVANKMVTHTQAEKSILADIDHPFIVKIHYAFQTKKHLVLVLDFLCGGELFFHLQRNKRFSESRARFYAAEIGTALEYIHSKNIIYRDLKPENLVLDRFGHVTLTDFGLAKKDVKDITHTFCGTPEYMAPELVMKKGHTMSVDWWSLGVFLYEMVAGLPPFYTQNITEMYDLILNKPLQFPSFFSPELRSILTRLLERDPAKRMQSGEEFRSHPFFDGINWEKLLRRELRPEFVPDVSTNDLRYFDKQFTQESTRVAQLDVPNDPNDPTSKKFEGFDYVSPSSPASPSGPVRAPIPDVDL